MLTEPVLMAHWELLPETLGVPEWRTQERRVAACCGSKSPQCPGEVNAAQPQSHSSRASQNLHPGPGDLSLRQRDLRAFLGSLAAGGRLAASNLQVAPVSRPPSISRSSGG